MRRVSKPDYSVNNLFTGTYLPGRAVAYDGHTKFDTKIILSDDDCQQFEAYLVERWHMMDIRSSTLRSSYLMMIVNNL